MQLCQPHKLAPLTQLGAGRIPVQAVRACHHLSGPRRQLPAAPCAPPPALPHPHPPSLTPGGSHFLPHCLPWHCISLHGSEVVGGKGLGGGPEGTWGVSYTAPPCIPAPESGPHPGHQTGELGLLMGGAFFPPRRPKRRCSSETLKSQLSNSFDVLVWEHCSGVPVVPITHQVPSSPAGTHTVSPLRHLSGPSLKRKKKSVKCRASSRGLSGHGDGMQGLSGRLAGQALLLPLLPGGTHQPFTRGSVSAQGVVSLFTLHHLHPTPPFPRAVLCLV